MVKVTNTGRSTLDFLRKGGSVTNGVPDTVSIGPGESANLAIDLEDPQVKAAISFGSLIVTADKSKPEPTNRIPSADPE